MHSVLATTSTDNVSAKRRSAEICLPNNIKSITLIAVLFEWDSSKAASNLKKHSVSFDEAATVFADPLGIAVEDAQYPDRLILVGMSDKRRLLFTVFAELDGDRVRIISARRVTRREGKLYEEGI